MNTPTFSTHTIAATAACRGINHVLESEPWACTELSKHAGKTILLQLPFGPLGFCIGNTGRLEALKEIDHPSLALEVSAKAIGDLVSSPGNLKEQAFKAVKIIGDADLAQLIGRLAGQLRWEYEEDLARVLGDAPAHFAVRNGKKFISATRSAAGDLLENLVEYVSEERKVLLNMRDFMAHKSELSDLRESVDRLEKRIQYLGQKGK
jgi:ubiquinone biosynthesis accessory factor UbiJ